MATEKSAALLECRARIAYVVALSGLTQEPFAKKLGVRGDSLSRAKQRGAITGDLAMAIEREFGIRAQWVLTGEGEMEVPAEPIPAPAEPIEPAEQNGDIPLPPVYNPEYAYDPANPPVGTAPVRFGYSCGTCAGQVTKGSTICRHCRHTLIWEDAET